MVAAGELGVIDPDVLWSCVTCGACVEQCPVDIEHVDHIVDMRRYQVLMESAFPEEAGIMLTNLEHAADPWGRGVAQRLAWAEPLERLFTDPDARARIARNARAEAERWTWRASSEAVVGYYEEAIAGT